MPKYHRLTWIDRLRIEKLYNSGCTYRAIAAALGRSVSCIHREVKRGLYNHLDSSTLLYIKRYSAQIAQEDAHFQFSSHGRPLAVGSNHEYTRSVSNRILSGESPDAIVGDLRAKKEWTVSTSTLYRYIAFGYIPGVTLSDLPYPPRKRRKRSIRRGGHAPAGFSIEQRPSEINSRSTFGHWEMDSVIGHLRGEGQSILVLTERLTRYELIFKVPDKSTSSVNRAVEAALSKYPHGTFKSITVDNGTEFARAYTLPLPVYYCHPFCSSERGSNENANRLIRRYFRKGESLSHKTQQDCDIVSRAINSMHRKILGYRTAEEVFQEQLAALQ